MAETLKIKIKNQTTKTAYKDDIFRHRLSELKANTWTVTTKKRKFYCQSSQTKKSIVHTSILIKLLRC